MKRNYSMPKMNMIEISNRLHRLKAVNKPRLQFPTRIESKKHYFEYHNDHVVLGQDRQQSPPLKESRRNNLDISDIEGARPKMIEKQKNVMNYYHNINQEYNPFIPMEQKLMRALSEPKLTQTPSKKYQLNQADSLDVFQKQMEKKLLVNPQNKLPPLNKFQYKRQITQPTMASYESDILSKKLTAEMKSPSMNQNFKSPFQSNDKSGERKSLAFNPTFLSNFVLL